MSIGERIKELRKEKRLTQSQLAKEIGYTQQIVADWETSKKKPASDAIIALAKFFDVSADYILGLKDE